MSTTSILIGCRRRLATFRALVLGALVAGWSFGAISGLLVADDEIEPRLREGWKWQVKIPERARDEQMSLTDGDGEVRKLTFRRLIPGARALLWVEQGWLCVRRTTEDDELEWQVVLARASDPERPVVTIDEKQSSLELTYRDYFIREDDSGKLRIEREPKSADFPEWPLVKFDPFEYRRGQATLGMTDSFESDFWTWLAARPIRGRPDLWLRLTEGSGMRENDGTGINSISYAGGADIVYDLRVRARVEPELLIATRRTMAAAEHGLTGESLRHRLGGTRAPALSANRWLNADKPVVLDELMSRLTLVGFWAGWSEPSVKKLRQLQALHKEFAARGLTVIGVHSALKADEVAETVRTHEVKFPIMVDDTSEHPKRFGVTSERYRVYELPAFFLIDEQGTVLVGYGMGPPPAEMIEALLKEPRK